MNNQKLMDISIKLQKGEALTVEEHAYLIVQTAVKEEAKPKDETTTVKGNAHQKIETMKQLGLTAGINIGKKIAPVINTTSVCAQGVTHSLAQLCKGLWDTVNAEVKAYHTK